MRISDEIIYVGVNDHDIDLFEGQYIVENGMSYNSYVIMDEKIAVMDSVDAHFGEEWLDNIKTVLNGRQPDYLVVQHMEPDHSANIVTFVDQYPNVTIVSTMQSFKMMNRFFNRDFDNKMVVKEKDTLSLGKHTLTFVMAPMVHWPEVMVTYDDVDRVLFTADAFGKFGALDVEEDWACEARRYYFGIVGKYGVQAQALLKKATVLDIQTICPLHGPVLNENLDYYFDLYNTWTTYGVEEDGVVIAYASVYGHTKAAALKLAEKLETKGCSKVVVYDLARSDMAEVVEDSFKYGKLVLASITYNGDVFPCMKEFINHLLERNYQNRTLAFIQNGSWAPMAAKVMAKAFENSKNLTILPDMVTVESALNETSETALEQLAEQLWLCVNSGGPKE